MGISLGVPINLKPLPSSYMPLPRMLRRSTHQARSPTWSYTRAPQWPLQRADPFSFPLSGCGPPCPGARYPGPWFRQPETRRCTAPFYRQWCFGRRRSSVGGERASHALVLGTNAVGFPHDKRSHSVALRLWMAAAWTGFIASSERRTWGKKSHAVVVGHVYG